jgi:hypothetical protein
MDYGDCLGSADFRLGDVSRITLLDLPIPAFNPRLPGLRGPQKMLKGIRHIVKYKAFTYCLRLYGRRPHLIRGMIALK